MEAVVAKSIPYTSRPAAAIDLTAPPAAVAYQKETPLPPCLRFPDLVPTTSPSALEGVKSGGSSSRDQRQRNRERVPPWRVRAPVSVCVWGGSWPARSTAPRASLPPPQQLLVLPQAGSLARRRQTGGGGGGGVYRGFSTPQVGGVHRGPDKRSTIDLGCAYITAGPSLPQAMPSIYSQARLKANGIPTPPAPQVFSTQALRVDSLL
jgi:hypothetical protein